MSKHARLESTIMRSLTRILREDVKDPAVGFVTITAVKLTNDLSFLTVYYTALNADKKAETEKALERSKAYIRTTIGKNVQMRKLPTLVFKYDESLDRGNKIESGLKKVIKDDK